MIESENTTTPAEGQEESRDELRRIQSRRRSLNFKRSRSTYALQEQWALCLDKPAEAKLICGRDWIVCLVCRQLCKTLALHLKPHNLSIEWYREIFGYPADEALICDALAGQPGRQPDTAPRATADELLEARKGGRPLTAKKWIVCPGSKAQACGLKLRQITRLHTRSHGIETLNEFRDEWLYPYGTPLCCEELSENSRRTAAANPKFKPAQKGSVVPRRKGYKMSRVFSIKQSERRMGKPRSKPKPPKRGKGKKTADRLRLCAAFEKIAKIESVEPNVYAMASVLYPLGPARNQDGAEAATRILRKRNRQELDRLAFSMTETEARQQIAAAMRGRPVHP